GFREQRLSVGRLGHAARLYYAAGPRFVGSPQLALARGARRIYAQRPRDRHNVGAERDVEQRCRDDRERRRIGGADVVQRSVDEPRRRERDGNAGDETERYRRETSPDDQPDDVARRGAERRANADLPGPLGDRI